MNSQPSGGSQLPPANARPNPLQLLFHVGKTFRLASAILADGRVSIFRKIFFITAILGLVLLVLLPADLTSAVVESIVPFVGPALGLPVDATIDWVAIALVSYNLMRVFPTEIVSEHYARIFRNQQPAAAVQISTPPSHSR